MSNAFSTPLSTEPLDHCESCSRPLYTGDMVFSYDDGPMFCWEHAPTWNDLKADQDQLIADGLWETLNETPEDAEGRRNEVLTRIASGEGDKRVARPPMTAGSLFDVCHCGDYRHQHDARGCLICRAGRAPWDRCSGFRLFEVADPNDPNVKREQAAGDEADRPSR